jgi:hypothetical protein
VLEDLTGRGMFLSNVFDVHQIIFSGGVGVVMYINGAQPCLRFSWCKKK